MGLGISWYLLGLLGAVAFVVRLAAGNGAERGRSAVLTAAIGAGALATIIRVEPARTLVNAFLHPASSWLIADSLWLAAGLLGIVWCEPLMRPEPVRRGALLFYKYGTQPGQDEQPERPRWNFWQALWEPGAFVLSLVAVLLWAAAIHEPEAWPALEIGEPRVFEANLLLGTYVLYLAYSAGLSLYFTRVIWIARAVAPTRRDYVRLGPALLAGVAYLGSPTVQIAALVTQWRMPSLAVWPAFWPSAQISLILCALLALPALCPRRLLNLLLAPMFRREQGIALAQLEKFHAWLLAAHPRMALPALDDCQGPERQWLLLSEIERASRYALAYGGVGTRTRLAELGEAGIYIAGRYTRRAEETAALLGEALRSWPAARRMPAELPQLRFTGDDQARLVFWGWVASLAV